MASPAVHYAMAPQNNHTARPKASNARTIAAPQASDALAGVFRKAFVASADLPDDFEALLTRLDRCEPGRH